ncbi:MAG: type II 3-dehydroquinate dehydratase [Myxococcales bacterium]|nr:type II 3-dehydroquinate dehydratase [Myxococcales bacterium]
MRIDVINGPNLNLLGTRQPEIYGTTTLADIEASLTDLARGLSTPTQVIDVTYFQSNHEGGLIDRIAAGAAADVDAFILNPGGYTHTSVAIRDALIAADRPVIEVHLSNVYAREQFRHRSLIADIVAGRIVGLGAQGYLLALRALVGTFGT